MIDSVFEAIRTHVGALRSRERLGRFASAGLVGAAVDTAVLAALVELTVLGPATAKVLSWEGSIVVVFLVNDRWTFDDYGSRTPRALGRRFLRSNLVRAGGFLVTLAVLAALVYGIDVSLLVFGRDVWYLAANAIGLGCGFVVNYSLESLFTWRVHRELR